MKQILLPITILFIICQCSIFSQHKQVKRNRQVVHSSKVQNKLAGERFERLMLKNSHTSNSLNTSDLSQFKELPYQIPNISYYETTPVALSNGNLMILYASYDDRDFNDDSLFCTTSTDGGETWINKKNISHSPFNSIYYLTGIQTNSGRIIAFWTNYDSTYTNKMVYSDDNGDSWSSVITIGSLFPCWYPSISKSSSSTLYLAYSQDINSDNSVLVFRKSSDDGITWDPEKIFSDSPGYQNMGSIVPGEGNELLAVYSKYLGTNYGIVKQISTDGGDSWTSESVIYDSFDNGDNTRVIRISKDSLCLLYRQWNDYIYDVNYLFSSDNGSTWNSPVQFTKYAGWDGYVSNLCLLNNKPFVAFSSARWQKFYNVPHIWYGTIGITDDNNSPPAVLYSSVYQYYFEPGKVETILGDIKDETGINNVHITFSLNGGPENSLQLFDDAQHNDWAVGDGIYGNQIGPFSLGDHIDYNFSVTDIDNNKIDVGIFTVDVVAHGEPVNTNQGFEETPVGVSGGNIAGWYLGLSAPASGIFNIVDDTVKEGNHALKIEVTDLGSNPWDVQAVNEPFSVEENSQYRYFVWAKADKDNVIANFDVEDSSFNVWQAMEVNLTTKWQEYSFDFSTPKGVVGGRSANWFSLSNNEYKLPITYYFDDLRIVKLGSIVSVEEPQEVPVEFSLHQNYPNPFNPSTTINYQIPTAGIVSLKVYDVLGREVANLVNEEKPAGTYNITFNAGNFASGVYFYQLKAGNFVSTKKLVLMK